MVAIDGLRRYGFNADADRVSYEFLSTVAANFRRGGNIQELTNFFERRVSSYQSAVVGEVAFLEDF
jgi:neutral trehalase